MSLHKASQAGLQSHEKAPEGAMTLQNARRTMSLHQTHELVYGFWSWHTITIACMPVHNLVQLYELAYQYIT